MDGHLRERAKGGNQPISPETQMGWAFTYDKCLQPPPPPPTLNNLRISIPLFPLGQGEIGEFLGAAHNRLTDSCCLQVRARRPVHPKVRPKSAAIFIS